MYHMEHIYSIKNMWQERGKIFSEALSKSLLNNLANLKLSVHMYRTKQCFSIAFAFTVAFLFNHTWRVHTLKSRRGIQNRNSVPDQGLLPWMCKLLSYPVLPTHVQYNRKKRWRKEKQWIRKNSILNIKHPRKVPGKLRKNCVEYFGSKIKRDELKNNFENVSKECRLNTFLGA